MFTEVLFIMGLNQFVSLFQYTNGGIPGNAILVMAYGTKRSETVSHAIDHGCTSKMLAALTDMLADGRIIYADQSLYTGMSISSPDTMKFWTMKPSDFPKFQKEEGGRTSYHEQEMAIEVAKAAEHIITSMMYEDDLISDYEVQRCKVDQ